MRIILIAILSVHFFLLGPFTTEAQEVRTVLSSPERLPYAIVWNEVDDNRRHIVVLLKDDAFKEANLLRILRLIEVRYPKPLGIQVDFFTNLDDIETPEERNAPHMTQHRRAEDRDHKGDYAVFIRLKKKQYGNCLMYFADGRFQPVTIN